MCRCDDGSGSHCTIRKLHPKSPDRRVIALLQPAGLLQLRQRVRERPHAPTIDNLEREFLGSASAVIRSPPEPQD